MYTTVAIVVAAAVSFVLGVLFHKQVVSEAHSIKTHVTAEVFGLEARLKRAIQDAARATQDAAQKL